MKTAANASFRTTELELVDLQGDTCLTIELLEQENDWEWAATGVEKEVEISNIINVIREYDYSQRQVDRVVNPHAEHAEEVFTIPEAARSLFAKETGNNNKVRRREKERRKNSE